MPCKDKNRQDYPSQALDPSSHTNYHFLSSSQKDGLIKKLRLMTYHNSKTIAKLQNHITELTIERGLLLDAGLKDDFQELAESSRDAILQEYPEGSFQV